jgi:glycosyltransferase involved in cell wall biosynthesis
MDVFAFPSYREGLPQAPLEAAFAGIPTVGYAATGTVDAVADGESGLLAPIGSVDDLANALRKVLEDDKLRAKLGSQARAYVRREFSPERGPAALLEFYAQCLTRSQPGHSPAP